MRFGEVRALVSDLPGVEDSTRYGTPALKVGQIAQPAQGGRRTGGGDPGTLRRLLVQTWREAAPKPLAKAVHAQDGE